MKQSTFLNGCGECGLADSKPATQNVNTTNTAKDAEEEAKQYTNSEIPAWLKWGSLAAIGVLILING